jgi:hypothetical protein
MNLFKQLFFFAVCLIFWLVWVSYASPANNVVISEVWYHVTWWTIDNAYEWIELFNPTQSTINLSWRVLEEQQSWPRQFVIPAWTSIQPWWYLLLVNSLTHFQTIFSTITPDVIMNSEWICTSLTNIWWWVMVCFQLNNGSTATKVDHLYLKDPTWTSIDYISWWDNARATVWNTICRNSSNSFFAPWERSNNCTASPWSWILQYVVSLTFSWIQHTTWSLPSMMTGVYYPSAPASSSWLVLPGAWTMQRDGYVLSWWNTQVDGSGSGYAIWSTFLVQSGNSVLFAQRLPVAYAVAFDVNNWTGTMNNQSFVYDVAQNLTGNVFTRVWYTFSWWNTQADGLWTWYTNNANVLNLTTTSGGIITLYAQRTLNTYLVTFVDRNSTVLSTGMVNHGTGAIAPTNPMRTGYTFSWWNSDFSMITGVTIVTGEYTINQYTISFDTDGGTTIASITDDYGTGIIAPTNPTKTGYTFSGWVPTIPVTMPAMDVTVTGQWTINSYTLSYTGWGADGWTTPVSQTGDYNTSLLLAANTFTRTGYTFSGWDCGSVGSGYIITMNTECTAQRTLNTYLVTFVDRNSAILSTGMVDHGSGATAPSDPMRTGYTFSGWNTDFSIITGVMIVTGEYTVNQYTLTFNSASGSFVAPMSGDYNSVIIPPTNPTRTGYAFSWWTPTLPITIPAMDTTYIAQWNDITNPVITLNGSDTFSIIVNRVYTEQWATCIDNHDPLCTVVVSWTVNTAVIWTYIITYTATDVAWNMSTLTRTVNVMPWWWTASSISWSVNTTPPVNPTPNNPVDTTPTAEELIEEESPEADTNLPLTESDKSRIFNPSFTQTCFDFINKQTIDQWVEVSETFLDAHQLFYSYSLTKRQWTKDYRPFSTITREEAARFFVEFAKNVLCRKPNYTYSAQFSDLSEADATLESFVKESYEFGIFHGDWWKNLSSEQPRTFRPKALMTQDELAAVIVRLVTNEYDETWWDDRSNAYKQFLKNYAKTQLNSSKRDTIAEVVYDVYRWNEYTLEDIGYVIKK